MSSSAALARAREALCAAEREYANALAEIFRRIDEAATAAATGDHAEASRLLTAAADLAFETVGDADAIDPLFAALGVEDGGAPRD